ncbi:TPA: hypothetical protein NI607_006335 [Pseudomonas aeruginosa]|uniref:hypothetical protein n=1 Tax=Pseudomonas aeruginosa TaxID=287 RepID=UPI00071B1CC1|nr:hypothetical protein [Pseudomonas aeruginosa]ALU48231.1 hypothetical protein AU380_10880 [Pseudomonas aeruginosa]KSE38264.1 hypothetical protein AO921_21720 [Pseudomonas aeruginosa]MDE8658074.1 hypothetical protein [Pseudomonas aeruginosa]MDE8662989.1 hypothetical protein [Pseudomonas aeruginosa]OWI01800.1 hypothetical protein CDC13_18275 [Pseudomonas aeruginosa]
MTVITHAYTPLMDVDAMSEEDCRLALKDVLQDGFAKDQQLVELKTGIHKLDRMLVKLIDLFIAGDFSKLHAELQSMAAYLQEQRAAQKSARKVH